MEKAKYTITTVVWYYHKDISTGQFSLRSSAVTGWTATNNGSGELSYIYNLADGSRKNENEIFITPLVAVSRLLDPLGNQYMFLGDEYASYLQPDRLVTDQIKFYIRVKFGAKDWTGNDVEFNSFKYFEKCNFKEIIIGYVGFVDQEAPKPVYFISCNFDFARTQFRLPGAHFDGSSFKQFTEINPCTFSSGSLNNCDFSMSNLDNSLIKKCSIRNSIFEEASLVGVDFGRSDLTDSNFHNARAESASFKHSNLTRCNLRNAYLLSADFSKAVLTGADLSFAYLSNATFSGAKGITNEQLYEFASKDADEYMFTGVDGETITVPAPEV